MTEISRRQLLLSAAAFSAAPLFIGRAQATDTDVLVIGAGAAGISAARALKSRGYSVITIEASGRIGGRILTDNESFGVPFDMGASRFIIGKTTLSRIMASPTALISTVHLMKLSCMSVTAR
ncbi:FAD-dependent oxidoreductase [Pseudovibrio denitrificans]|uniref:FAD-dependent oxidoreductase n=1 Tax=Pseudovibrio denitrificans TaxID=258256 RepID=UPI000A4F6657|nr:FAD-dependent oxidoreductase [Pseudovibrio denitrificans]